MAYQSSQSTTSDKIAETLNILVAGTAGEGYNKVLKRLNSVSNVILLMANKIFIHKFAQLLPGF